MLTKKEDVLKKLDELKIDYELMEHEAVYTIEEMENLNMPRIDEVIKNLFVRDEKKQNLNETVLFVEPSHRFILLNKIVS